jgi:flagellar hook protein FlgE
MSLIGTLGSGVSALRTFMKGLEVIGNNIANVNTTGFKSAQASYSNSFSNVLQQSSAAPASGNGSNTPATEVGNGVTLAGISTNFGQGSLSTTGKVTDLGISGNGFFVVRDSADNSSFVTRAGDFRVDSNGFLVTQQGLRVQGLVGGAYGTPPTAPTTVGDVALGTPPTGTELQSIAFNSVGELIEYYSDGTSAVTNQVLMQQFLDPSALTSKGNNIYASMTAAGPVSGTLTLSAANNTPGGSGLGTIRSGTLEQSNVDLTDQFASLISTQRSFQAGSRLVTVSDSILEDIVNLKR